ncbi:MAG: cyoD [Bradyrhizobium sp.]|nr:cyoD [Bradyrhizobium sp.]
MNEILRRETSKDTAPGDEEEPGGLVRAAWLYLAGFGLSILLSVVSFFVARTTLVWAPSIPIAISVLALAQMGVHLVFFLHVTSGPESANNIMALAFGLLIVMLLVFGSLWIMSHLNHNMIPMDKVMNMQR